MMGGCTGKGVGQRWEGAQGRGWGNDGAQGRGWGNDGRVYREGGGATNHELVYRKGIEKLMCNKIGKT